MRLSLLLIVTLLASSGCEDGSKHGALTLRPIIDSHVHIVPTEACIKRALKIFKASGITRFCAKSAGFYPGARFRATVAMAKNLGPRFAFLANVDWRGIDDPAWPQREARRLSKEVELGARGFKVFKNLGLGVRTSDGKLLAIDDARLDPLMKRAADLGVIVAMHTADPRTFFDPPTPDNERYMELLFAPSWSFYGKDYPSRDELFAARERLIAHHPDTTFLLIHLANNPEDLTYVDRLLDTHPNVYVDTSARLGEIGRHPAEQTRKFFIKHQDRILFGSDIIIDPGGLQLGSLSIWPDDDGDAAHFYAVHREYFETDHRQIDHPTPIQGDWKVDAINLPADVLEKFYVKNAEKLIWGK